MDNYNERVGKLYTEMLAWKKRQDRCNGFSKNKDRDGSRILEDNFEILELVLRGIIIRSIKIPDPDVKEPEAA